MAKTIFAIVIIFACASLLVFTDIGAFMGQFGEYVIKPIGLLLGPLYSVLSLLLSFQHLAIIAGIFFGAMLLAFFFNKFTGQK